MKECNIKNKQKTTERNPRKKELHVQRFSSLVVNNAFIIFYQYSSSFYLISSCFITWLPLNTKGPEQGRAHIPIQTPIQSCGSCPRIPFQTPSFQTNECSISKLTLRWVSVPCPFHTCSIPVPDQTKHPAHTPPVSLIGTRKSQSPSQTLRIRPHRNLHAGNVVLISSLISSLASSS